MTEQDQTAGAVDGSDVASDDVGMDLGEALGAGEQPQRQGVDRNASKQDAKDQKKSEEIARKYRVKVDGRELEVDEKELVSSYQKSSAADKRLQEAARQRKQVEHIFQAMQNGDLSILEELVPEEMLTRFAEQKLMKFVERESMSPAERKAYDLEQKNRKLDEEVRKYREQNDQQETSKIQQQADMQVEQALIEGVKSVGMDINSSPRLVVRMAEQLQANHLEAQRDPNVRPLTPQEAAKRAAKSLERDFSEYVAKAPPEKIMELLPPALRDAIRRADVNAVVSKMPSGVRRNPEDSAQADKRQKRVSFDDFFASKEKRYT